MKLRISLGWAVRLSVVFLALSPATAGAQTVPASPLSEDIQEQLDDDYPGWTLMGGSAPGAGCHATGADTALAVTADFDNDGSTDYGIVITMPDGTSRVLAIVARVKKATIHELGSWTPSTDITHLRVLPMGRKFRPADTKLDDYFSGPTLAAGTCTAAVTAYLWVGTGFRATPLTR